MPIAVIVTIPKENSRELVDVLLKAKLCACVNIIDGVESRFWWEGKIDTAKESILIIKTDDSVFTQLEKTVKENHPYQVPEIIAINIDKINEAYLKWLVGEVKPVTG
jgi:periplasmic divalent cation tolerance protein